MTLPCYHCCAQGQNKTYYHVKDIAYLLHEPLLKKARELHAYEKKVGGRALWKGRWSWRANNKLAA